MDNIIECKNLEKRFKEKYGVKNINLDIEEGKLYGVLGRNGAGKTTLLNLIAQRYIKTNGEIKIYGEEPFENTDVLSKIFFINDDTQFINKRIEEIFKQGRESFGSWDEEYKNDLVSNFSLNINERYKNLSTGNKALVRIILGLASKCPITIFDEVYSGLDASSRKELYKLLLDEQQENKRTVLFSTHLIDEADILFENVVIIHEGEIILNSSLEDLTNKSFEVVCPKDIYEEVVSKKNIIFKEDIGNYSKCSILDAFTEMEMESLRMKGVNVGRLSLQDLFINLTQGGNKNV